MIAAKDLRDLLFKVFPSFTNEWEEDEEDFTHHAVIIRFTEYFGKGEEPFSEKQISKLAEFINDSVVNDDELENAISTCFLEHLRQIRADRRLLHYLSKLAKKKMHA